MCTQFFIPTREKASNEELSGDFERLWSILPVLETTVWQQFLYSTERLGRDLHHRSARPQCCITNGSGLCLGSSALLVDLLCRHEDVAERFSTTPVLVFICGILRSEEPRFAVAWCIPRSPLLAAQPDTCGTRQSATNKYGVSP